MKESYLAKSLLDRKAANATLLYSIRKAWKILFLRVIFIVSSLYFYIEIEKNLILIIVVGGVIGATLQDIGWFMGIKKSWNFTTNIIDWSKVERIAKDDS